MRLAASMTALALLLLAACAAGPPRYAGYALEWSDEFEGCGAVDEESWVYELGFVRNQEAQWYSRDNVRREDGVLVIEARREPRDNPGFEEGSKDWRKARRRAEYTSGSIKTRGKREWLYGRVEMRGRIDVRPGLWPAFWTVGVARPWPACGEIDVMEFYRGVLLANAAWGSAKPGAAAWDDSKTPLAEIAGAQGVEAWARRFHTWRMDWDEQWIRLYVDGRLLNEVDLAQTVNRSPDGANPFHEPQHLILNLALGGTSGGDPSATALPARFEVDWVRVYARERR